MRCPFPLQAVFEIADLGLSKRPSISVVTVLGDGSSMLHVRENQTFYIEYQEFTRRRSFPPVNFRVEYSGELMLVSDFHVAGKKNPAFDIEGRISGVSNLTLTEGRLFLGRFSLLLCVVFVTLNPTRTFQLSIPCLLSRISCTKGKHLSPSVHRS